MAVGTTADAEAFLAALTPEPRRAEALYLDAVFRSCTGWTPRLWGSILGYGRYAYRYDSGRRGEYLATGFSPRASEFTIYIMPDLDAHTDLLGRLGRHRAGKGCLYIRRLPDIDEEVLRALVLAGIETLSARWPVTPD